MSDLEARTRIEEAHGLWELRIARVAALVEGGAAAELLQRASAEERDAFDNWQRISRELGA